MNTEALRQQHVLRDVRLGRYVYVFTAVLFIAATLTGFVPTSLALIDAVSKGTRPLPWFLHMHAIAMGTWLLLLLAQTTLVAKGNLGLHRKLGMASVIVAPIMVVSMLLMSIGYLNIFIGLGEKARAQFGIDISANWAFLFTQLHAIVLFTLFVTWAFLARRRDPETHKRMMFMATVVPITAAFGRMVGSGFLPGQDLSTSHIVPDSYDLMLLAPLLVYDLARLGRLHRAFVIGLAILVAGVIADHFLWNSEWWMGVGRQITGLPLVAPA